MDLLNVHKLYEALADAHWAFLYSGNFHDEHSARLIDLAEEASRSSVATEPATTKKLAFVLVEVYQNIIRHRLPLDRELERNAGRSLFMLRNNGRSTEVAAMNPIRTDEAAKLRTLLDHIKKNSDLKQLKELFLRGLQSDSTSQRGGAGLGLIEMARRSTNGIQHELRVLTGMGSMLTIQLHIGAANAAEVPVENVHELQQAMAKLDALLVFRGAFTPAIQASILRMLATDLHDHASRLESHTKALLAAMELIGEIPLQNADPMIVLGRSEQHHSLVIALALEERDAERLSRQVAVLQEMDPNAIQRVYRDALLGRNADGAFTSTGAIDLARRSRAPLSKAIFGHREGTILLIEAII